MAWRMLALKARDVEPSYVVRQDIWQGNGDKLARCLPCFIRVIERKIIKHTQDQADRL